MSMSGDPPGFNSPGFDPQPGGRNDHEVEDHKVTLPGGSEMLISRVLESPGMHLAASMQSLPGVQPPHLLVLAAEEIPGFGNLHSIAHLDAVGEGTCPKLKIATLDGETRIHIRMGGPRSSDVRFLTLEQLEALMPVVEKLNEKYGGGSSKI